MMAKMCSPVYSVFADELFLAGKFLIELDDRDCGFYSYYEIQKGMHLCFILI
jgi:hypothetical protein